jgi:hypothetical protein
MGVVALRWADYEVWPRGKLRHSSCMVKPHPRNKDIISRQMRAVSLDLSQKDVSVFDYTKNHCIVQLIDLNGQVLN